VLAQSQDAAKGFIDGHVGTTGLRFAIGWRRARISTSVVLSESGRKGRCGTSRQARSPLTSHHPLLARSAARALAQSFTRLSEARLIDASTRIALPTASFGLPELEPGQRERRFSARRAWPTRGCYSSALILLTRPVIDAGAIVTSIR
jgi:hypothetical protein